MVNIINKIFFIFLLFSISNLIYADDTVKKINKVNKIHEENEKFDENLPAEITEATPEFIYKFLLAEIATQRGEFNSAGHLYLDFFLVHHLQFLPFYWFVHLFA